MNCPEDAKKNLLGEVEGLFSITQQVASQLNNCALVLGNQLGGRPLVARSTTQHQRRLTIADVRPSDDSRLFHPSSPVDGEPEG